MLIALISIASADTCGVFTPSGELAMQMTVDAGTGPTPAALGGLGGSGGDHEELEGSALPRRCGAVVGLGTIVSDAFEGEVPGMWWGAAEATATTQGKATLTSSSVSVELVWAAHNEASFEATCEEPAILPPGSTTGAEADQAVVLSATVPFTVESTSLLQVDAIIEAIHGGDAKGELQVDLSWSLAGSGGTLIAEGTDLEAASEVFVADGSYVLTVDASIVATLMQGTQECGQGEAALDAMSVVGAVNVGLAAVAL